jgi:hypothetical protein
MIGDIYHSIPFFLGLILKYKLKVMNKLFNKIDWILMFRLVMSGAMIIVGIQTKDMVAGGFGAMFAIFSLVSAKYKVGCGYQSGCGVAPRYRSIQKTEEVEFTEIK